nr:glycosyltransferase [Patulibacter sp. SYSU D01012]
MAANRPGRHGAWQRPRERLLLARCPLLVPQSAEALAEVPLPRPGAVVVPPPVDVSAAPLPWEARDVAAVTYAADPHKKGLDRVLAAWARARRPGELLVVCGAPAGAVAAAAGGRVPEGVQDAGRLSPAVFADVLGRSRAFVTAPRREDHGLVQLEALAAGTRLVTTTAPGAYVALSVARAAAPRLVVDRPDDPAALAAAVRRALDAPRGDGEADDAERGRAILRERFAPARVDAVVREQLLPALLR